MGRVLMGATLATDTYARFVDLQDLASGDGLVSRESVRDASPGQAATFHRVSRTIGQDLRSVFFANEQPMVYFAVRRGLYSAQGLRRLRLAAWNDGMAPVLVLVDDRLVRIYDSWCLPPRHDKVEDDSGLLEKAESTDLRLTDTMRHLNRMFLESGEYAERLEGHFDYDQKSDATLLENLRVTVKRLAACDGITKEIANHLVLRSILLLNLEHRSVRMGAPAGDNAGGFLNALRNRKTAYHRFHWASDTYNGDLLPLLPEESRVDDAAVTCLQRLLKGNMDAGTGQLWLWPLYDFSAVPIQLISAIYENLLQDKDIGMARETGTYYTPHSYVESIVNDVLSWPSTHAPRRQRLPKVIDPACGSGLFLVEAYRRLMAHWRRQNGRDPSAAEARNVLTSCIFGVDSNETALKIAAFSLSLAFLDHLEPGQIAHRPKFPPLRGASSPLRKQLCRTRFVSCGDV